MRVLHCLNLDTIGGVEQLFRLLGEHGHRDQGEDHLLVTGNRIHPFLAESCRRHAASVQYSKYWHGLKLPKWPPALRALQRARAVSRVRPEVGLLWNRFGDFATLANLRHQQAKAVYYEHGSAWLARQDEGNMRFLAAVDAVFCASVASRRLLELRWNYRGPSRVVLNCLRPDLLPAEPAVKTLPPRGPIRLGIAARLVAVKGIAVALHALKFLREGRPEVELHIAGDGPLRASLGALAKRLGLGQSVLFHGCVRDMAEFYRRIHLLLMPSVREPFGMAILEGAAHGCPAVGANVDGIAEAIVDGVTGICLRPTVHLSSADELDAGGDLPPLVYEPAADCLSEPKFLAPDQFAAAIDSLLTAPDVYGRMGMAAAKRVRKEFSVGVYVKQLRQAIETVGAGRVL